MAFARVVSFDDVSQERIQALLSQLEESDGPPEDIPATEMIMLNDPENGRAMAVLFFETEDDYRRGDAALGAMPADETPGRRSSVAKYEVAFRMSA